MPNSTSAPGVIDTQVRQCIDACSGCASVCVATITHCLQMGGRHADPAHLTLLRDCAVICDTAEKFLAHGSQYHGRTCGICAEVCEACAASCERVGGDEMKACAEACRRAAASCRPMAS